MDPPPLLHLKKSKVGFCLSMVCNNISSEGQRAGTSGWSFIGRPKDSPALFGSSPGLGGQRARGLPRALMPRLPWSPRAPQRRWRGPAWTAAAKQTRRVAFCTGRPSGLCLMKEPRRRESPSPILPRHSGPGAMAATGGPCMTGACKHCDGHSVRQAWGEDREDGPPGVLTRPRNPDREKGLR